MDPPADRSFLDLHCHSSSSFDSLAAPADIVARAARIGLTHVAVTDHERLDGALRARDAAPPGVTVIVGEEVRTVAGDLIGLFLETPVAPGLSPAETAAAIHEQGGLCGLPHPFDRFRSSGARLAMHDAGTLAALVEAVDYVEVHNARAYGGANPAAAELARAHGLPGVASSDAHTIMELGVAYTIVPGSVESASDLRKLLPEASLVPGRGSFLARLWAPGAKLAQRLRGNRRIRPESPVGAAS